METSFRLAQNGMYLKWSKGQSHGCIKPNAAADQSCLFCGRTAIPPTHAVRYRPPEQMWLFMLLPLQVTGGCIPLHVPEDHC